MTFRPVDPGLYQPTDTYLLCHAFNYTGGISDVDYNAQEGGGALLNATLSYPVRELSPLDLNGVATRPTAKKRLVFRLRSDLHNLAQPGDALVLLPASVGQCGGAAALHRLAACDASDSGDVTAASTLEIPSSVYGGDAAYGVETRQIRLEPQTYVVCHAFASDIYTGSASPSPPPPMLQARRQSHRNRERAASPPMITS